ncbi:MAG: DUF4251 domain-containing protein [Rikenellaceae bacterium]
MKTRLLFICIVSLCVLAVAVTGQSDNKLTAKQEKREVREKRRADKQAAYEKMIDSIVLSHTFQFNPQTMQQQPAGSMRMISNPNFNVGYWDGTIDVFLPYIKGYVPPYHNVIINYTLPSVQNYITEQTEDGWRVTFETTLFTASTYTFVLEISSRYGGATLTLKNPWYNDVQYTGSISKLY